MSPKLKVPRSRNWVYDLLLVGVLLGAAALRFTGIYWDEDQHLHPDERFLTGVVSSLEPVDSLSEYFDTENSTLNPNNRGSGFFVYGTLPVFMVRYAAEWVGQPGYGQVNIVGRMLSGLADLGVVFVVYLIAARLFDRRVALLAAIISAVSVMQIQQSHFWTVDNFVNFFTILCVYFAVRVATPQRDPEKLPFNPLDFIAFGTALGCALASKVSVVLVAGALPVAVAIRIWSLPANLRIRQLRTSVVWVIAAALISLVVFRVFQPYAFIGFGLNPHWVDTMQQLSAQVNGDADWPPSMQWARRSFLFGFENIVLWGLGIPLAIVCWAGFAWAGWRIVKGEWTQPQVVVWGWGLLYFVWQSIAFNPTMRYFLPLYPVLAVFGGWFVIWLWDAGARRARAPRWQALLRPAAALMATAAVVGGTLWAVAFVQIYRQPHARIAAARWIYENVPGPITLTIASENGVTHQPIGVSYTNAIDADTFYVAGFNPHQGGQLTEIDLKYVVSPVELSLSSGTESPLLLANEHKLVDLAALQAGDQIQIVWALPNGPLADSSLPYKLEIGLPLGEGLLAFWAIELRNSQTPNTPGEQILLAPQPVRMGETVSFDFILTPDTFPDQIVLHLSVGTAIHLSPVQMNVKVSTNPDMSSPLVDTSFLADAVTSKGGSGNSASVPLSQPVALNKDQTYYLQVSALSPASVSLFGGAVANESSWDDGQPLRIDGYDGFGGIYQGDLNFEMYWDENAEKIQRFENVLDNSEYIFITSNRQWGSLPRLPERFPLVVAYYRALLGCPESQTIDACYETAQVGTYSGQLGFDLIQVFENEPRFGDFVINDQGAEEAFTVYDHPKVFVFKKNANYDSQEVASLLGRVPVDQAIHVTPKQASGQVLPNLMLPADRLAQQQAGGTWSELFNRQSFVNVSPWVSLLVWYLALGILGIAVYPLVRLALPGLRIGSYPFARISGLLLLSYLAWMGGSLGLTFSRGWLLTFFALLAVLGVVAAWKHLPGLKSEWKTKRKEFIRVEILFLIFFAIMLLIRYANPDLWHPSFGGEKPMDFSYFNAVLKSTSFPPYDPWFAGGYINYYYYGFVLVGSLVKLLGIVPAVAYNLILPSLFAMLALGAYGVASNIWAAWTARNGKAAISAETAGVFAAVAILLLGNLGSLQMILQGFVQLGAQGATMEGAGIFTRLGWMLRGTLATITGEHLQYGTGSWYWNPTRIFPAPNESAPITEFPLFTFTYADLHAHMVALPVTLLALGWSLSAVLSRAWEKARSWWQLAWVFSFGALIIGSLRPINTWDLPTYLAIAAAAVMYAVVKYAPRRKGISIERFALAFGAAVGLALLSLFAYQPFSWWYRQGYSSVRIWDGVHVSFSPYFVHWGIFLFFISAWMIWETRQWLASTPLSSVRKLQSYVWLLPFLLLTFVAVLVGLQLLGVHVGWLLVPLVLWAGLLLIRPKQDEEKRLVLFMVGTGIFLSLMVEVIVLNGDISRMNTVFKFYLQAWTLLSISAALGLAWAINALRDWQPRWRAVWQVLGAVFLVCGAMFMFFGVGAKMVDRMSKDAPHTLDGMTYMKYSIYYDKDQALELKQDYDAILWMQDHVQGSPVIVEAYTPEYRWGGRFVINTGLPGILGWNFHQRQQREFVPGNDIWGRVAEIDGFYTTTDLVTVKDFLSKYQVHYIVVGQLEHAYYPGLGLEKFEQQDGILWREVYRMDDTVIYEVLDSTLAQE